MKESVHCAYSAVRPEPQDTGTAPAALVGRQFAEALEAGLRRASAAERRGGGRRPGRHGGAASLLPAAEPSSEAVPEPPSTAATRVLVGNTAAVLRRFQAALPTALTAAEVTLHASRPAFAGWAHEALRAAAYPGEPSYPHIAPLDAEQRLVAGTLLLECAAATLPSDHPASGEALRAVARAIRTTGRGATPAPSRRRH